MAVKFYNKKNLEESLPFKPIGEGVDALNANLNMTMLAMTEIYEENQKIKADTERTQADIMMAITEVYEMLLGGA